jgi:sucrose-6-phosphate hydrolase SacC (GH32 family)
MKNLNNFTHIVVDISEFKDSEKDILDSIVAIKSMYNIRIIIVAIGYSYGNSLLGKLFGEGIYNFVTAIDLKEQEKELNECVDGEGKQYKDSIRYRLNEIVQNTKDKVVIKKEYKKLKQFVTIAVVGNQSHIGTTTQAIAITKFLNELKLNACYIQANGREDIQTLENTYDVEIKNECIRFNGIDMYAKDKTVNAIDYGYDFYIYDFGTFNNIVDIDNYITKDVKIIVSGSKTWEQENLVEIFKRLSLLKDIHFIFCSTPEKEQKDIMHNMGKFGAKTYFSSYIPNPFEPTLNESIYHKIFKEYILEKSSKMEVISNRKKGIFNFLKRGDID